MDTEKLVAAAEPAALADYLISLPHGHDHGHGSVETVREAEHKGHHIAIRTTYEVIVDGRLINVPLGVDNEGQLHLTYPRYFRPPGKLVSCGLTCTLFPDHLLS